MSIYSCDSVSAIELELSSGNNLAGKIAMVTGAASGIGRSIVHILKETGCQVFEIDIKFSEEESSSSTGSKFRADLTLSHDVQRAFEFFQKKYQKLDILVNSSGIEMSGNVVDLAEDSFEKVMDTNVKSVFLTCKHAIPIMLKSKQSSIINISSDIGLQPVPNTDAYAASKGAVIALTKALSKNWARQGLRVNCIAPGPVDTPLLHRFQSAEMLDFVKNRLIPAGRLGTPEEIAEVALFLASDRSSFINGAILTVNGGLVG